MELVALALECFGILALFIVWLIQLVKSGKQTLTPRQSKIFQYGNWLFFIGFLALVALPDLLGRGYTVSNSGGYYHKTLDLSNLKDDGQWHFYILAIAATLLLMFIGTRFIAAARKKEEESPK